MSLDCPICMPKHRADMAQPEIWRDEHSVRAEGWLHPSAEYCDLLHCNTCGAYFQRLTCCSPLRAVPASELPDHRIVRSLFPAPPAKPAVRLKLIINNNDGG